MIKFFLSFAVGCIFTLLIVGFLWINYSDYVTEALLEQWVYELAPKLENSSENFKENKSIVLDINQSDFHKLKLLHKSNDGSILLKGQDNKSFIFFYPTIKNDELIWRCISNSKFKQVRGYVCE